MRISFVEPHLEMYGGIRRIVELSNRLVQRGHEVTIFHPDGKLCEWLECLAEDQQSVIAGAAEEVAAVNR